MKTFKNATVSRHFSGEAIAGTELIQPGPDEVVCILHKDDVVMVRTVDRREATHFRSTTGELWCGRRSRPTDLYVATPITPPPPTPEEIAAAKKKEAWAAHVRESSGPRSLADYLMFCAGYDAALKQREAT